MKKIKYYTRKSHRYLGLFIGIQLLLWSVGGLYFSWTDIDEIHGDHLVDLPKEDIIIQKNLLSPDQVIEISEIDHTKIKSISLISINGSTFYKFQNKNGSFVLMDAKTGEIKVPITKEEALIFAKKIFKPNNDILKIEYVTNENISNHSQYRNGTTPAWAVTFDHKSKSVIYISTEKGTFEKIRSKQWRIFDFLWMLHIMDFDEREDINNYFLRGFSILSLFTILSGFFLFYQSSKTIRSVKQYFK